MESLQISWCWIFMAGELDKEDIEYFLAIGVIQFSHVNHNGEEIYRLTEKAKELAPDFYEEQMKDINSVIFSLWNKGMINIVFDDNGEPLIGLQSDTGELLQKIDLDEDEHDVMEEIILSWYSKYEG